MKEPSMSRSTFLLGPKRFATTAFVILQDVSEVRRLPQCYILPSDFSYAQRVFV